MRRKEQEGRRRKGEKRTAVEEDVRGTEAKFLDLRRDCSCRGLQICTIPISWRLSQSLSLSLSKVAETFDTYL